MYICGQNYLVLRLGPIFSTNPCCPDTGTGEFNDSELMIDFTYVSLSIQHNEQNVKMLIKLDNVISV